MTTIAEIMTPGVTHITAKTTVQEAARLMRDLDVGALPVMDGDKPMGIITDRDLVVRCAAQGRQPTDAIDHGMTKTVETVKTTDDINTAMSRMEAAQIRRLLVLDPSGKLAGIVSLGDLAVRQQKSLDETLEKISEPA